MNKLHVRIRIVLGFFVVVVLLFAVKLYHLQIVQKDVYVDRADRQYIRPQNDVFDRGTIFFEDKNGEHISAATLRSGYTVAINPKIIDEPDRVYLALSSVLDIPDEETFLTQLEKTDDPYEEIAKRVDRGTADALDVQDIDGVGIYRDRWRFYPANSLAAHTLGFVAYDEDTLGGRYGLERYYDRTLRRDEDALYVNVFAEVFSNIQDIVDAEEQNATGDIVTTIEPTAQAYLEDTLQNITDEWNAKSVGGIVIDPMTGEIFALGVNPTFDLNAFQEVDTSSIFSNSLVEDVYEMGSIIKPLTVAAGLDAGVITPNTTYNDRGFITANTATISNYDGRARGVVDMQEVLNQSLNTGVSFIVSKLGNKQFAEYFKKFGLGEETGIDLPAEGRGLIDNLNSPRDVEHFTASFGQGIALTPIATVRALSALGNGGVLITPHLVKEIAYDLGFSKKLSYPVEERVITEETSETITKMLVKVVDDALKGGTVKLDRYSIAAKTGTAQIADRVNGGYYDDRFLHSFFGYFPAYEPRFLVFLYAEEPKGARYASETLTDPFMDIVKFLINYYEIMPDR